MTAVRFREAITVRGRITDKCWHELLIFNRVVNWTGEANVRKTVIIAGGLVLVSMAIWDIQPRKRISNVPLR